MSLPTLVQSGYTIPGAYLGRKSQVTPSGNPGLVREPNMLGQGSRVKYDKGRRLVRSYIEGAAVTFSGITYLATLVHAAAGDKSKAVLRTQDGTPISTDKWSFQNFSSQLGGWTQIQISADIYDANVSYSLDYQSVDRAVLDPLGFDQVRSILAVGNSEGQRTYKEGIHFIISTAITQPVADAANANKNPSLSAIAVGVAVGTATLTANTSNAPTYRYNRHYLLTCTAIGGASPNRSATFRVEATALSGGNATVPDQTLANQGDFNVTFLETAAANIGVGLGDGILLDLAYGLTNAAVSDTFSFDVLGGAKIELEATLQNTNQFPAISTTSAGPYSHQPLWSANTGTGTVVAGDAAAYVGLTNRRYELEVTAVGGAAPNRTATVRWRALGELVATTGTLSLTETPAAIVNILVEQGVRLTFAFGASNFVVGDMFNFEALAPRTLYSGKDDRDVTITVTAATSGPGPKITASWLANTREGSNGSLVAIPQDLPQLLRNNLYVRARNLVQTNNAAYFVAGNKFTFSATCGDTIDWSLQEKVAETILSSMVRFDQNGGATGTTGAYYVAIENAPDAILSVTNAGNGNPVAYSTLLDNTGALTPLILFATNPGVNLQVVYVFKSQEPNPGDSYFVTATKLRLPGDYNIPIRSLTKDELDTNVGPMEPGNHIYIAGLLGFQNGMPVGWTTQVQDPNDDGTYDLIDYRNAIDGSEQKSGVTDTIVLGSFGSTGYTKNHIEKINDPFLRRPRIGWFGVPINTPIGDVDTVGSRVYTSTQTLRFFGDNPARGKTILAGNSWCKVTVQLPDGSTTQVTLDGTFIAAALAGKQSSFADPAGDLLGEDIAGFDDMEKLEEPDQIVLGAAGITCLKTVGNVPGAVFRVVDSLTCDPGLEFRDINGMTQDEAFQRKLNADVQLVIGLTPPTGADGVDIVGSAVAASCRQQAGAGTIAPYQDEHGNRIRFDKKKHMITIQDEFDKDLFRYFTTYFRKNTIKRVLGVFGVGITDVQTFVANN